MKKCNGAEWRGPSGGEPHAGRGTAVWCGGQAATRETQQKTGKGCGRGQWGQGSSEASLRAGHRGRGRGEGRRHWRLLTCSPTHLDTQSRDTEFNSSKAHHPEGGSTAPDLKMLSLQDKHLEEDPVQPWTGESRPSERPSPLQGDPQAIPGCSERWMPACRHGAGWLP